MLLPPRYSKRFKNAFNSENSIMSDLNPATKAVNTKGLPILPNELYLEIISYYPTTPIPHNIRCHPNRNDDIIYHKVLLALSQTSRNLRRFFLCYLWQRIEVYRIRGTARNTTNNKALALKLVRQLEIVTIRDPTLAKSVQIVNVEIGAHSRDSVLAKLARCLALFPNLHTVQLNLEDDASINQDTITNPFEGYIYPSIRTTVVSSNARAFLRFCPESRIVDSYDISNCPDIFWDDIAAYCPRMEVAPRNATLPVGRIPEIAKTFPEICHLTLRKCHLYTKSRRRQSILNGLMELKRLKVVTIVNVPRGRDMILKCKSKKGFETARKLLLDLQRVDGEDKVIVLEFCNGKTKTVVLRHSQSCFN